MHLTGGVWERLWILLDQPGLDLLTPAADSMFKEPMDPTQWALAHQHDAAAAMIQGAVSADCCSVCVKCCRFLCTCLVRSWSAGMYV
jgi:hypothetical protein